MTRGRRKDTTVPLSRSLIVQRAYRDRKAKYLSDLEDRCRKVEEENERLRNELELARFEPTAPIVNGELVRNFCATFSGKKRKMTKYFFFKTPCRLGCALISCGIWSKRKRCCRSFSNECSALHENNPNQKGTCDDDSTAYVLLISL